MSVRGWRLRRTCGALVLASQLALVGCSGGDPPVFGDPTGSVCPPEGTALTYENFAKPFAEKYCTRCHHSDLVGAQRQGAPSFHDFDTLCGIAAVSDHIDETTAAGPASINEGMPNEGVKPSEAERRQLGEWIACGMPEPNSAIPCHDSP